jgi:hypothetical protein
LVGKPEGKRELEDLSVDGKIILRTILGNWGVKCGQDSSDSVKDLVAGPHEYRNKPCRERLCSTEPGISLIEKLKIYSA